MDTRKLSLPLYIHIPFCRFKCFYCDFNTYAGIENLLPNYVDALTIEIQRWGEALRQNGVESETPTVFFGGGTPSLLKPTQVAAVLGAISNSFALRDDAEISMEVNPESVTREFVARRHGARRKSIQHGRSKFGQFRTADVGPAA